MGRGRLIEERQCPREVMIGITRYQRRGVATLQRLRRQYRRGLCALQLWRIFEIGKKS